MQFLPIELLDDRLLHLFVTLKDHISTSIVQWLISMHLDGFHVAVSLQTEFHLEEVEQLMPLCVRW